MNAKKTTAAANRSVSAENPRARLSLTTEEAAAMRAGEGVGAVRCTFDWGAALGNVLSGNSPWASGSYRPAGY